MQPQKAQIHMQYVYLDNFRGFQQAVIPVLDINFCVGENSTGKTSFLSAINLLSSSRFWFDQNFDGNETAFKHFDDYVSVNSSNRASFRMGIAEPIPRRPQKDGSRSNDAQAFRAVLFKYTERGGLPVLECCTAIINNLIVTVHVGSRGVIKYRVSDLPGDVTLDSFSGDAFSDWEAIQDDVSSGNLNTIRDSDIGRGYFPPLYAVTVAYRHAIAERKGSKPRDTFWFPSPAFGGDTAWIAPIRTKPQRTYDEVKLGFSPEGTHTPYVVKRMLKRGKKAEKFVSFLRRFGSESGLFKEVKVHTFGRTKTSPFELEIILDTKPLNISNVGYGVSQVLPVVVEALVRPNGTLFAIQQPEVHLHPRAQASIGEMLFVLASSENKKFIVETHSDFTIDRFRTTMRQAKQKVAAQVLFFQRECGINSTTSIPIEANGDLGGEQPAAYREFFLSEEFNVIGM